MHFLRCSDQPNQGIRGLWVAQWLIFFLLLLLLSRKTQRSDFFLLSFGMEMFLSSVSKFSSDQEVLVLL